MDDGKQIAAGKNRPALRLLWLLAVAFVLSGMAQPAGAQEIAVLKSRDLPQFDQVLEGLAEACDPAGMRLRHFNLGGKDKAGMDVAEEIRQAAPDIVLALGRLAASVGRRHLQDLPILYCMVPNPARYDLEGQNIAGISQDVPGGDQFSRFKSLVPSLRNIGVIYDPEKSGAIVDAAALEAEEQGLVLVRAEVSSSKKVPKALRGLVGRIDALWMVPDNTVLTSDSFRYLLLASFENKMPLLAISDIFVEVGALASITPKPKELGRQVCTLIQRYSRGELDLAAVDILPPNNAELVINLKTAEKIGLTLSDEVLREAGKLYQ